MEFVEGTKLEENKPTAPANIPDGGYGWIIVFSSFMINFLLIGIQYSFGVYLRYYIEVQFLGKSGKSELAIIGSLASSLLAMGGIIAGPLADKFGYRNMAILGSSLFALGYILASFTTEVWQLFLTQGVLAGLGSSIGFFPAISIPSQWFDKKRGLATGICLAGSGLGGLVFSPITQLLMDSVGIAWCLRITGLIVLGISCGFSLLLKERIPAEPYQGLNFRKFKDSKFIVLWISGFISCLGYLIPFFMIVLYATKQGGVTPSQAALLLGILNCGNAVGRVALGAAADRFGKINIMALGTLISGLICFLIWPFATSFGLLVLFCSCYGFMAGALFSLLPVVSAQLFGTTNLASTNGLLYLSTGLATFLGAPFASFIVSFAESQNLDNPFLPVILFAGGSGVLGGVMLFGLKCMIYPIWSRK